MRNKILLILMGVCLLTGTSCSDSFLEDKRDYNNMIPLYVFSDPAQASAVLAKLYRQAYRDGGYSMPSHGADAMMRQGANNGGQQYGLSEEFPSGFGGSSFATDGRYTGRADKNTKAGNHIANPPYWNQPRNNKNFNNINQFTLFPTIYLLNDYIKEIDNSRSLIDDNQFWDRLKGQAIFLRAWIYFDAARFYGGVPYYCTELDSPQPNDVSDRMSVPDMIEKICADLEHAASLLPDKYDETNEGRLTRIAALAMISRVRVYAASPVFNASWDNPGGVRWQKALDASLAAEAAANAAGYGTSVTNIDTWDKSFYGYASGVFNPEAIIKIQKSDDGSGATGNYYNTWENVIRPGVARAESTQAGLPAPDQMLMEFPMKDGKRPTVENGYDDVKFYRNRDPRFYKTFAFSGCQWPGGKQTQIWLYAYRNSATELRYTDGSTGDGGANKKSRALVWKMSDPNLGIGSETTGTADILEYRYAEILLNIAECYAAQGNAGKCLEYLGKIRSRIGIPSANNYGIGAISDRYALIEAVLYERRIELAYEGKRVHDMKRWLLFEGGAGFDPQFVWGGNTGNIYDAEAAYGQGWKLYNGTNGRPNYSKTDNVLTKLGLSRWCGKKHTSKVWAYDLGANQNMNPTYDTTTKEFLHPLRENADLNAVPNIRREMSEAERNAAFDKLDAFYANTGITTVDLYTAVDKKYGMDSGSSAENQNFQFAWRGWYYSYPIHYDMYDSAKGNSWISQTEGWMVANATTTGGPNMAEQDGTYVYCTPE
ncbi:RagB/SusD family nutrient uptake outer membrane protein [Bacteroides sp. 214]|uniref:RagB/SusD family nutrient uptake outer membrane protein n=1 Tax=Bacteroides sp. 214 TaxID=2302935 RepID=UPI0013D4D37B|nr:RagB/SusD family nutrient uptake outer membrane protein [Bacteroides sp. 214]NDW12201.1 RagB/SusD family nutrient uptake outer membrane protein [Bacteroides sp. 214]